MTGGGFRGLWAHWWATPAIEDPLVPDELVRDQVLPHVQVDEQVLELREQAPVALGVPVRVADVNASRAVERDPVRLISETSWPRRTPLRELDGWQVRKVLLGLRRSLGVFEGNSTRLLAFLGQHGDARKTLEALETLELHNRAGFEKYLDETDRLLHNFLAAAESLRDHVEVIQKKHLPDPPGDADTLEFKTRKDKVFDSPAGSFVRELRQHVLHERIPETGGYAVWGSEPDDLSAGISLDCSELQAARQWGKKASRYMADAGGDILISEVAGEFRELVVKFCDRSTRRFAGGTPARSRSCRPARLKYRRRS